MSYRSGRAEGPAAELHACPNVEPVSAARELVQHDAAAADQIQDRVVHCAGDARVQNNKQQWHSEEVKAL